MRRVGQLATPERLPKVEAALRLGLSHLGFLLPPHLLLRRWVESALRGWPGTEVHIPEAQRLARITDAAARRLPLTTRCLQRALTLVWLLRRRGVGGRLRIGVRRTEQGIDAHAWVEVAGSVVNDSPHHCSQFVVLEALEQEPAVLAKLGEVA